MYDSVELQLRKYAEDNKLVIAELQAQVKARDLEIKQMTDLIKQAVDLKHQAEQTDKIVKQKKVDKPKETP